LSWGIGCSKPREESGNSMKLQSLLLLTLLPMLQTLPVLARPATLNGASMYRDANNNLYVVSEGLATDQRQVRLFNLETGKLGRVDACGVIAVSSPVPLTDIKVNGTAYLGTTVTELPTKPWVCRKNADDEMELMAANSNTPLTAANTPSADKQIRVGNALYLFNEALANTSVAITYKGNNVRSIPNSACGLFVVRSTTLSPLTPTSQVQLGTATPVVMSSLPLAPAAPRCSAVGAGVEVFVPTSWVF
jgi:hypothetical protein